MKILYFTSDFSASSVAKAKASGLTLRNRDAYSPSDFVEECDAVCGDVPDAYKDKPIHQLVKPKPKVTTKAE